MAAELLKIGNLDRSEDGCENSWTGTNPAEMHIRQPPDYATNKQKGPSESELFEVFATDAYKSPNKVPHFAQYVDLPEFEPTPDGSIPPLLIVNLMIPSYGPSILYSATDGPGWCAVFYCKLSAAALQQLEAGEPGPSLKLLKEFICAEEGSAMKKRFKCIAKADNIEEVNFSQATQALVKRYNGTPFLARTTTSFYRTEKYFEIDLDVHNFGKPARMGLYGCSGVVKELVFDWAFVVEGVEDDELPERLLTCLRVVKVDPDSIPDLPFTPKPLE